MDELYDVYFAGQVLDGQDPQQVRSQLARLFNADEATLDRLFSGKPSLVKRGCDRATAGKYKSAMEKAGAVPVIRAQHSDAETAAPQTAAGKIAALAAAPEQGQYQQESPQAESAAELEASEGDIGLAPPGTEVLMESERTSPVTREIDTSALQVDIAAARLSEESDVPPVTLDTSHLSVAETGATIPNLPSSETPLSPDTDSISLSEPGWDLSDCAAPDAPPPSLDLSGLTAEPAGSDILEEQYRKRDQGSMPATDHLSLSD
jgi:hypothetical protein